jgi:hypothetical protein
MIETIVMILGNIVFWGMIGSILFLLWFGNSGIKKN